MWIRSAQIRRDNNRKVVAWEEREVYTTVAVAEIGAFKPRAFISDTSSPAQRQYQQLYQAQKPQRRRSTDLCRSCSRCDGVSTQPYGELHNGERLNFQQFSAAIETACELFVAGGRIIITDPKDAPQILGGISRGAGAILTEKTCGLGGGGESWVGACVQGDLQSRGSASKRLMA